MQIATSSLARAVNALAERNTRLADLVNQDVNITESWTEFYKQEIRRNEEARQDLMRLAASQRASEQAARDMTVPPSSYA